MSRAHTHTHTLVNRSGNSSLAGRVGSLDSTHMLNEILMGVEVAINLVEFKVEPYYSERPLSIRF